MDADRLNPPTSFGFLCPFVCLSLLPDDWDGVDVLVEDDSDVDEEEEEDDDEEDDDEIEPSSSLLPFSLWFLSPLAEEDDESDDEDVCNRISDKTLCTFDSSASDAELIVCRSGKSHWSSVQTSHCFSIGEIWNTHTNKQTAKW